MMFFLYLILFVFFCFVLIKASDIVMAALRKLILTTKVGAYGISAFLLALSTSLPELLVGISSALQGKSELSLGNVLGANIANLSLVLGGAAMVSGVLRSTDQFLKKEVFYVFFIGSLPLLLLVDGNLSRLEGMFLLAVYFIYQNITLRGRKEKASDFTVPEEIWWRRMLVRLTSPQVERGMGMLFVGVALLILAANMMVRLAVNMADMIGIPVLLIGLFIISVGTTLPELTFEIMAIRKREVAMAFGNILGSVVTNSTLVLGTAVMLQPISLNNGLQAYLVATLGFVGIFFMFWYFVWTKHRLERWEGAALFTAYVVFAWLEFIRMSGR